MCGRTQILNRKWREGSGNLLHVSNYRGANTYQLLNAKFAEQHANCCSSVLKAVVLFQLHHGYVRRDTRLSLCVHVCVLELESDKMNQALCANFVLQVMNMQGLRTRLILMYIQSFVCVLADVCLWIWGF